MEYVIAIVVLLIAAWFVSVPLRHRERGSQAVEDPVLADLEARKQALYRQIRDAELDRAQGKLSEADWRAIDAELRREAIEVLRAIDAAGR